MGSISSSSTLSSLQPLPDGLHPSTATARLEAHPARARRTDLDHAAWQELCRRPWPLSGLSFAWQNRAVLLSEIVNTSAAVASTPSRRAKIDEIARLLVRVPADEVPIAVAFLS